MALKKTLLPRAGFGEPITSVQQWLLQSLFSHEQFDVVDFVFCEMQDVITLGLGARRMLPYAQIISRLLSTFTPPEPAQIYADSPTRFPFYTPVDPRDRRRGRRALRQAQEQLPPEVRVVAEQQDQALAEAEAQLPAYFHVSPDDSEDSDFEIPQMSPRAHDAEAGTSSQPPPPPVTESSVTQPSELTAILQSLADGQRRQAEQQAEQSRRFEASQTRLQEELLRQTQRQTEMINNLHQQQQATSHTILQQQHGTAQMFTWLAGCIGVLYQSAGLAPPAPPQIQVPPTATTPLPSVVGGF